jgi:hypothetical protein
MTAIEQKMTVIGQGHPVIEEVRRDREDLARVLKRHTGIRKIVEDLYPDSVTSGLNFTQNQRFEFAAAAAAGAVD